MREKSLILSLPTQGKGEVNLLVDPVVLSYFLGTAELGTNGYIAAFTPDGQLVAGVGVLPHRIDSKILSAKPQGLSSLDSSKIQVRQSTRDGKLTLVGEVPVSWVLRYWWRDLIFGAPLALVCSGVLTSLFMRFARRTYGIEQEIQLGLKNYEFEVYYQPIIDLQTERCVGSEALIRWRHPELGLVLPEVFIPIAEKTGMIRSLSQWVIQRAIQDQITLLQSADFYTSINLSPSLLTSKDFLEDVVRTLKANALPSTRILFEITENRLLDTIHLANLSRYRDLGLRLALDDFGTGYANFDYLDRFEFDFLKIDRYFVQRIRSDEVRNPVVDTLIELSQSLGFEIVAEGVETKAQRHYLHRFGVQYAQGWLFARAMPLEEFKQFLANRAED
jgi:sensor c-di-GMP phosphodiesterase-like protein